MVQTKLINCRIDITNCFKRNDSLFRKIIDAYYGHTAPDKH